MNTGQRAMDVGGAPSRRLLVLLALGLAACGSTPRPPVPVGDGLQDPDPRQRTTAVLAVARARDLGHVPVLIELLDDPDPAVRMASGVALRDLTGRESGYQPYAEAPQRRAQVLAWRAWWQSRAAAGPGRRAGAPEGAGP